MTQTFLDEAALAAAKAALRTQMRALRRAFIRENPQADWQAGDRAGEMVSALGFKRPGICALYHASGAETDPRPMAEELLKLGWKLALPWCEDLETAVIFRAWKPGDKLAPDAAGIASPLPAAPEVRPDLIICPLLAFDLTGNRLGQGGGYYDRTLSALRAGRKAPPVVGLAFSAQQLDAVPVGPHDQKLDAILTEKGYRRLP